MGLFKKGPKRPTIQPDRTFGDPLAGQVQDAAVRGDWDAVSAVVAQVDDWDDRDFLVDVATRVPGVGHGLDEWVAAAPDDPLRLLLRGACHVHEAWEARGGGLSVTDSGAVVFIQRLELADEALHAAAALDDTDPTPWAFLLIAGRGLELETDELRSRFAEVTARHRWHRAAHNQMVQGLTEKWGGSHEAMFEFARQASAAAPEGSGVHAVIAEAHIERALFFAIVEDREGAEAYWKDDAVREELRAAAAKSVDSPRLRVNRRTPMDRNFFAYAYWRANMVDELRREVAAIGTALSDFPWVYAGDPAAAFARAQQV